MLEINRLQKHIGGLKLADGIDLHIGKGERHALIGANGAGKTSLFRLISGQMMGDSGSIIYQGQDITRLPEHRRARLGIACSFQRNNLFMQRRVIDNLRVAALSALGVHWQFWRRHFSAVEERVATIADMFGLSDYLSVFLIELSYGTLRQLEIAMAYTCFPQLLLLDEPMAGMSSEERKSMVSVLDNLPAGLTMMMIEHDMDMVFSAARKITVMHAGAIVMSGSASEVRANEKVQSLYLGKKSRGEG